jgi:ABC-type nickel/cobalt efflux system permease component RcnA
MSITPFLLAVTEVEDVLAQWKTLSPSARERLIVITAIMLIAASVLVWAVFVRKSRRRQRSHQHGHHHSHDPARDAAAADGDDVTTQSRKRRKWRRPRREHRPRNPTLAETGGLPPMRTGGPPESRA